MVYVCIVTPFTPHRAPWVKNVWFFGKSYIIPNVDSVVVGGTAQKGNWDLNVSREDTKNIMDGACELFPSLRDAPMVRRRRRRGIIRIVVVMIVIIIL